MVSLDSFFSTDKLEIEIEESQKKELFFVHDGFDQQYTVSGNLTVVQLIYNLLFLVPGTYPNSPKKGIGIQNYFYEILSNTSAANLEREIKEQINLYIPSTKIQQVKVQQFRDKVSGRNNLALSFQVGEVDTSRPFTLYFSQGETDGRISTRIINH